MGWLVGTAGHVDHGKTTLIAALTGIDPDRLPDEKRRGMTIDLGFAFLDMPDGTRVSIVDVPGHERLVTNMLAGATGVDVALLCVAADEGPKPQTREHLAILELLPVREVIVVLTRCDRVDEPQVQATTTATAKLLAETRFAHAAIVAVSAFSGEGLDDLVDLLSKTLRSLPEKQTGRDWVLPIDRVFTVKGYGCVVTGTLLNGIVSTGDEAMLEPHETVCKVRGIQRHAETLAAGEPGTRVAINLTGANPEEIRRGMLVGRPGFVQATDRMAMQLNLCRTLKPGERVRVHLGAGDAIGRAFPTDDGGILEFDAPVAAFHGQAVVLRHPSTGELVGGGRVTSTQPPGRRRVDDDPGAAILNLVSQARWGCSTERLTGKLRMTPQTLGPIIEDLRRQGKMVGQGGVWWVPETWHSTQDAILATLNEFHRAHPAASTHHMVKVAETAGLPWRGKALLRLFQAQPNVVLEDESVRLKGFRVALSSAQQALLDRVLACLDEAPTTPPSPEDMAQRLHVPLAAIQAMVRLGVGRGDIIAAGELFFSSAALQKVIQQAKVALGDRPFTVGQFREAVGSTRKFVVPLLEHLDQSGVTTRDHDLRTFSKPTSG
ncbi:MAG: selenocysteine-specific translation elongation factor [Fimbriimonadaceae bacterium]